MFAHAHIAGLEHLASLEGPVIFASNHQSHLDTPLILSAVPRRFRRRTAVAMWKEYFDRSAGHSDRRHGPRQADPAATERRYAQATMRVVIRTVGQPVDPHRPAGARAALRRLHVPGGRGRLPLVDVRPRASSRKKPTLAVGPLDVGYAPPLRYREAFYRDAFDGVFAARLQLQRASSPRRARVRRALSASPASSTRSIRCCRRRSTSPSTPSGTARSTASGRPSTPSSA